MTMSQKIHQLKLSLLLQYQIYTPFQPKRAGRLIKFLQLYELRMTQTRSQTPAQFGAMLKKTYHQDRVASQA
jgi:hypothetical protein